jgi:hypothetical protein
MNKTLANLLVATGITTSFATAYGSLSATSEIGDIRHLLEEHGQVELQPKLDDLRSLRNEIDYAGYLGLTLTALGVYGTVRRLQ